METVTITFPDVETAKDFMIWLDNLGEQYYFQFLKDNDLPIINRLDYSHFHRKIIAQHEE